MIAQSVALDDVTETVMGQAPPGTDCNKEGKGTIFVKAGEFSDVTPVIREWTTNPLKLAKNGDVLVCVVGATAGKINLGIDCAIGRSVAAVRPNNKCLDTGYLHYFLRTKTDRLRAASQGLAQGVITREMLSKLEIPLPPLDEQRRIAAILDKTDALRRKRERAIELLDSLNESTFKTIVSSSEWPRIPFGDAVYFQEGPGIRNWQFRDSGIKLVNVRNIVNGVLNTANTSRFLSKEEVASRYKHFLLDAGDFVLASSGVTWGKIAEVKAADLPICLSAATNRGLL